MDIRKLAMRAAAISASLLSASGCSFSQFSRPSEVSVIPARAQRGAGRPSHAKSGLLYLADNSTGNVYSYSFPQGKYAGSFQLPSGNTSGECTDPSGDLFVTTMNPPGGSTVYEYAYGGSTPINTLSDPGVAYGCAVDPNSGTLAVSNSNDTQNPYYHNAGDVALYADASGQPSMYYAKTAQIGGFRFCGYDDKSNLYVTAVDNYQSGNYLVRLASGSSAFEMISLSKQLYGWGSVQWDGKHIAVSSVIDGRSNRGGSVVLYRLAFSGSAATVVGTTKLKSEKDLYHGQIWIQGDVAVAVGPYKRGFQSAFLWSYPKGGTPSRTINRAGNRDVELFGVTVAVAKSG
jgi:hypothetical protein